MTKYLWSHLLPTVNFGESLSYRLVFNYSSLNLSLRLNGISLCITKLRANNNSSGSYRWGWVPAVSSASTARSKRCDSCSFYQSTGFRWSWHRPRRCIQRISGRNYSACLRSVIESLQNHIGSTTLPVTNESNARKSLTALRIRWTDVRKGCVWRNRCRRSVCFVLSVTITWSDTAGTVQLHGRTTFARHWTLSEFDFH